jgi:hypothetical protein
MSISHAGISSEPKMTLGAWYMVDSDQQAIHVGSTPAAGLSMGHKGCAHHVHIDGTCYEIGHMKKGSHHG